jgi:hypothetical protein
MRNARFHVQRQSATEDLFQRREIESTQPVGGSLAVAVPAHFVGDVYLAHVRLQRVVHASETLRHITLKLQSNY